MLEASKEKPFKSDHIRADVVAQLEERSLPRGPWFESSHGQNLY